MLMEEEVSSEETSDTPVTQESDSQPESTGAEQIDAAPAEPKEDKPAPFHEHPRFKELIEQTRTFKEQNEQYRQEMTRLQAQMEMIREANKPKVEQPQDPFLADLEKVNPEYARSLKTIYDRSQMVEKLEQRLSQFEQADFASKAVSHFNKILDEKKISDPWDRKIIERAVRSEVYDQESRGKKLNLKDLEKITNDFHAEYKASMDARERSITAKYVKDKTGDKTPKGATGGAAKSPTPKKLAAGDISGQAKWLAEQIKVMKKEH